MPTEVYENRPCIPVRNFVRSYKSSCKGKRERESERAINLIVLWKTLRPKEWEVFGIFKLI